jgi:hypothetical protein
LTIAHLLSLAIDPPTSSIRRFLNVFRLTTPLELAAKPSQARSVPLFQILRSTAGQIEDDSATSDQSAKDVAMLR